MLPPENPARLLADKLAHAPIYRRLSEDTKQIVIALPTGNNIRVIAGAGSGKTETLTLRIINLLLCKKAAPRNIVAFTFILK